MGVMLYFFTSSSKISAAAREGLIPWGTSVVPALLPYLFLAIYTCATALRKLWDVFFRPFTKRIFRLPGESAFVMITGYSRAPISTALIATLRKKETYQKQGEDILGLCTNVSPSSSYR